MNLWKNLDKITTQLQNSPVKILMLDFDGTLASIVKFPEKAKLSQEIKNLLIKISKKQGFYLAVISGRSLKDLREKVGLKHIIYAGNHGLEGDILKEKYLFPIPDEKLVVLKIIKEQLNQIARQFKGVFIEDKGFVLSLHYRLLASKYVPVVKSTFERFIKPYIWDGLISVLAGKMVFDIYPKVGWNKGSFAKLVIDKIQRQAKTPPAAIFVGDDITDEDIFRKLERGITVKVGDDEQSQAKYRLKDTDDVLRFLEWINAKF